MELISKLPEDIVNRIIPYTYNIQCKELLEDVVHYNNSLRRIIKIYKKSVWCPLPQNYYIEANNPYKKGLLFDKQHKVDKLLDLDARYSNALTEAATHRLKAKTLTEAHMLDIVMAKQGQAVSKMKSIKNQIKTAL